MFIRTATARFAGFAGLGLFAAVAPGAGGRFRSLIAGMGLLVACLAVTSLTLVIASAIVAGLGQGSLHACGLRGRQHPSTGPPAFRS